MVADINNNKTTCKAFRRPILEILADLQKPVLERLIKQKPVFKRQGGQLTKTGEVNYIPWTTYVKLLDFYAPGWDYEVTTNFDGSKVVVIGKLTIKAQEGDITRGAIGCEDAELQSYGDAYTNAEATVLRRCASKFGLSLALWER